MAAAALGVLIFAAMAGYSPPAMAQADVSGYLSTKYRYRATDAASDQDLYQYLALDLGNPLSSKLTFHFFGRATADLDGHQGGERYYVFDSINDTYDNWYTGRIYYAYLDAHGVANMEVIRLGRQLIYDAPVVLYFDGLRLETAEKRDLLGLKLGAYGGLGSFRDRLGVGFLQRRHPDQRRGRRARVQGRSVQVLAGQRLFHVSVQLLPQFGVE